MAEYTAPSMNPGQSALAQFSDSQLLILILTELRLLTQLIAAETDTSEDLDVVRIEMMNDVTFLTADAG